ncbi:MAG: sugar phosphate isomerase/epimerase [Anaerolineae bacterium]|nr:sugar phosphate isomerase/epimerase [Thermoflexales bacterium]MDW8406817.1 sugar phosphate isomerase/epimerase [Anaerolineae bacterium]
MKIGVAGYLPIDWRKIDTAATRRVREAGFSGAHIFIERPLLAELSELVRVKQAYDEAGLAVAQTNGWYECLIHPDEATRAEGIKGLSQLIRIGRVLDSCFVYVRPGSINPNGHWWPHPDNHAPRTFDRLVDSIKQVCRVAETEGMVLGIEGHVVSTLDTPQRVRDLLDAVGSPALKFNMDPVNFVGTVRDVHDTTRVINSLFDMLGKDMVALHAKDCAIQDAHVVHIVEVPPCTGTMNYELLMRRWVEWCPEGYFIIEHLPDEQVPAALQAIRRKADALGIPLE